MNHDRTFHTRSIPRPFRASPNQFWPRFILCAGLALGVAQPQPTQAQSAAPRLASAPGRYLALQASGQDTATTAATFTPLAGMTVTANVPAGQSCLVANFSGNFMAGSSPGPNGSLALRALLDGQLMQGHREGFGYVGMALEAGQHYLVNYQFFQCGVAAGSHTIQIQWRTHPGAPTLVSMTRTLAISQ